MTSEARTLKHEYWLEGKTQWKSPPIKGNVEVTVRLYFGDRRARDLDNYNKLAWDALTGVVWVDDRQIIRATLEKFIDTKNPRIEIDVRTKNK